MQVPILTPDNSFNFTCACGSVFLAPKPMIEVINQTALLPVIICHQTPIVCSACNATYRLLVTQVQAQYGVQRMDVDLVAPGGAPLSLVQ